MPADHDAIREVNRPAFGRPNEARLVDAIRESPAFIPELSLVAVRDGRVLGHALFSRVILAAFMALPLRPGALDRIRGTLIYPPAFEEV